jgi:hypothetical protein
MVEATSGTPDPVAELRLIVPDALGRVTLDGTWEFRPGDHVLGQLDDVPPAPIQVPGLWEAQGYLELDGVAWYRLRFAVDDAAGYWTLRFGAVMDIAEVFLNGERLGSHEHSFTPFELPVTHALRRGVNVLDVRVTDLALDDPLHIRSAHGKQGWANHVFPSRPSLYMTYGGIWQSVTLRRHGPVVTRDVFVNADPDNLVTTVDVLNVGGEPHTVTVGVRTLGLVSEEHIQLGPGERRVVSSSFGRTNAAHWSPDDPVLHRTLVDVQVDGQLSDRRQVRYGLRTITIDGADVMVDGRPFKMKSVLVQGFHAERLYAEGTREDIVAEVQAAKSMGFNTLRLHIKAFDPLYLDVCDELGVFLECDLPIAEPIAHEELGDGTELSRRCVDAITEQVRRDRNHPSIILWSAMNELCLEAPQMRGSKQYEEFARTLYGAVRSADPTRPCIENEWWEPDPDRVFCSPIITAHWYGRLHHDYLTLLADDCEKWSHTGKVFYVSEFGDWGLPLMPELENAPFWDTRHVYQAGLASTLWPDTIGRFVRETQRYQGLSDRLQIEIFRRMNAIGGYCVTELTDVPHELNGILDLHRRPKPMAVSEIARANQPVLPMLAVTDLVGRAGGLLSAPLHVSNDGPALRDVEVTARFGDALPASADRLTATDTSGLDIEAVEQRFSESVTAVRIGDLPSYKSIDAGTIGIVVPDVPGSHDLIVTVTAGGMIVGENRYPIHVVENAYAPYDVQVIGEPPDGSTSLALRSIGARVGATGPIVIAEAALDERTGQLAADELAAGRTVIVLAQPVDAAGHYPLPVEMMAVETVWGSSVFDFTTESGLLPSFPRRNVLAAEESTVQALSVVTRIEGVPFPSEPVVIAYKPVPAGITGTVVGRHVGATGTVLFCQYRLCAGPAAGNAVAAALLADLVRAAATPVPELHAEAIDREDGRVMVFSHRRAGAA